MEPSVDIEPGLDIDLDRKILPESDISKTRARVQRRKTELGLEIGFDLLSEVSWLSGAVSNVGRGNFSETDLLKPRPVTQKAKLIQVLCT